MTSPLYLMYQADNARQPLAELCALARDAYVARFGALPPRTLVNADTPDPLPAGAERSPLVRPGVVWAGGAE